MTTVTPIRTPGVPPDPTATTVPIAPPLSAFVGDPDQATVELRSGAAGYVHVGRWAIMPGDPLARGRALAPAVREALASVRLMGLRPVVVATEHPGLWERQGLRVTRVADDARIDLPQFALAGKRMAKVRHAVTSAERSGLRVQRYRPDLADELDRVSSEWLATKRGGEMRLTLGAFDPSRLDADTCRVATAPDGRVVGFVTWRSYGDGRGRVLDLMRRLPDAPNPTMDALIAASLLEYREQGVEEASLNAVPLSFGPLGEHLYPTASLRSYKEKFAPRWVPQWMVTPSRVWHAPALLAVARAYCPDGLTRALRRNG